MKNCNFVKTAIIIVYPLVTVPFSCDVIRGIFQCVNVARVTLADCHHRVCFDCLAKRITTADALDERPRCPFSRCANYLAGSEVLHVAEKVLTIRPLLPRVMPKIPDVPEKLSVRVYIVIVWTLED